MPALIEAVFEGLKRVVSWGSRLFMDGLREGYERLVAELFGTPIPDTGGVFVFGEPTNAPWLAIRTALVGGEITMTALLVLLICVQARHTLRIFDIGGAYTARRTKQTAWVGVVLIVLWYWIAVTSLYLVNGFTVALVPDLDAVAATMTGFLGATIVNPVLAFSFAVVGGLSMWVLEAVFFVREILLYVYVYGMPIAFAIAFGNVPVLSSIARGFATRFVPLAVLPLPAAVLFQGYLLLFGDAGMRPTTAFLAYVVAVSLPVVVLYVSWKTFQFGSPTTARVLGGTAKGAVLAGGVTAGAAVGGASVGATAARWGPKAAASQAVAQRIVSRRQRDSDTGEEAPSYRRTENEPANDLPERSDSTRGMAFDRGIH